VASPPVALPPLLGFFLVPPPPSAPPRSRITRPPRRARLAPPRTVDLPVSTRRPHRRTTIRARRRTHGTCARPPPLLVPPWRDGRHEFLAYGVRNRRLGRGWHHFFRLGGRQSIGFGSSARQKRTAAELRARKIGGGCARERNQGSSRWGTVRIARGRSGGSCAWTNSCSCISPCAQSADSEKGKQRRCAVQWLQPLPLPPIQYIQVLVGLFPVCSVLHSTFLSAHSARMCLCLSPPLCSVAIVVGCERLLML
jgi:hypothetical protein